MSICTDRIDNVEFVPGYGLHYHLRYDFTDSKMMLGDYIKLGHLNKGDVIFITNGGSTETLFVGNCTENVRPTRSDGGNGWNVDEANNWQVLVVYGVSLNCGSLNGSIISNLGI